MKILAIDTSCDETAAAVTENSKVLSNVIWSQASLHAHWGGVVPSLAQREHEKKIDWVIDMAMQKAKVKSQKLDAIAVTVGPGLSIALGVGIDRAKKLAIKYKKTIIAVNHLEAHMLSAFANSKFKFPMYGLVLSGGNTLFVLIKNIGDYEVLAQTEDDALGEALDKAARLLGFGYPGASMLERVAREGDPSAYKLPLPLIEDKVKNRFSYSGVKTAFNRLVSSINNPTKKEISDLAAAFQEVAFDHIIRVLDYQLTNAQRITAKDLLFGGGVANNLLIRKKLRVLCKKHGLKLRIPHSKRLLGDNAAMIGITANLNPKFVSPNEIDRKPNLKI